MRSALRRGLLLSFATLASCDCGKGAGVVTRHAVVAVLWTDAEGAPHADRDARYDFGLAFAGERVRKKLVVRNEGAAPLTLSELELLEGPAAVAGREAPAVAVFHVPFSPGATLGAQEELDFEMEFAPVAGVEGGLEARLRLHTQGPAPGEETAHLTLVAQAGQPACALPREIDFGPVAVGERASQRLVFHNRSLTSATALAQAPQSSNGDHLAFVFAAGSPQGELSLGPDQRAEVVLEFAPTERRGYQAALRGRAPGPCPERDVVLRGAGVDDTLTWTPASVDFGFVEPNTTAERRVTFANSSSVAVRLTDLHTTLPNEFGTRAAPGTNPAELVVPAQGTAVLPVLCRPAVLGPRAATLEFATPLKKLPRGAISLACLGGGPNIFVSPRPTLAFGVLGYSASQPQRFVRKVTVMNTGTRALDPSGNLRLGKVTPAGPGQPPLVELLLKAGTAAGEITVSVPVSYDAALGLEAVAGRNLLDLEVTVEPKSLGAKGAELLIHSNDADEPTVRVEVTADAQTLPPCRYAVTPAQLNFGMLTPPDQGELPVTVRNLGVAAGDVCLVQAASILPGSDPAYALGVGPSLPALLQPGQALQLPVRVRPTGQAPSMPQTLRGTLKVTMGNAAVPEAQVPLETLIGASCLVIAPNQADFGTVRKGCRSAAKTFSVYNICSQWFDVMSIGMLSPAGQAAGGPDCPGTAPCPEFALTAVPNIPSGGLTLYPTSAPLTFAVRYGPIDLGADLGAAVVETKEGSLTRRYVLPLRGLGNATGQHTDTFVQSGAPKADILFVIDDSSSMQDKQTNLANNFASFIAHATTLQADYQIGVTTTDDDPASFYKPEGPLGKLLYTSTNPKVLTPTTPNLAQKFKDKVNVGIQGSATEKGLSCAMKAVTAPLVNGANSGFLRFDAHLAVVVVTDANDQSPQPATYYLSRLQNAKGNQAHLLSVSVVGPFNQPVAGCIYDGSGDDGRYALGVSTTGGVKEEICSTNWAQALQNLGKVVLGLKRVFFLTGVPDLTGGNALEVKINGAVVPASSGAVVNWTYDPASNAVTVDPAKAPTAGQTLTISYTTVCL